MFSEALWDTVRDNLNSGVMRPVATTLLGASAASIVFSAIPGTWRHLYVVVSARGTNASTFVNVTLRINGDSAGNYDYQVMSASGASGSALTAGQSYGVTALSLAGVPAASGTASRFGPFDVWVPNYAATDQQKSVLMTNTRIYDSTAANFASQQVAGWWRSSAAVSSLTLAPLTGSFASGTRATLYALGEA